jgi:hypothetical protein
MIDIEARLRCNCCRTTFIIIAEAEDGISRRDMQRLRHKATSYGWDRLKLAGQTFLGDYCGQCLAFLKIAKASGQAAREGATP